MIRSESRLRSALGLTLCALILGSSVAVPLIERGGFMAHPTLESEHDPSTCAHPHDHRVCTQIGANLALVSRTLDHRPAHVVVNTRTRVAPRSTTAKPLLEGPPPRAPPLA